MKVHQIMRREARTCTPDDSAATAGQMMGEVGCGWLPVVWDGRPIGVVTDRDLCLALADKDRKPSELKVAEAMTKQVRGCLPGDDVREALSVMRSHRVRRLVVFGEGGGIEGMLSLDDVVLEARPFETTGFTGPFYSDITATLRAVVRRPALAAVAMAG
jgi:CBS domain-containing protein